MSRVGRARLAACTGALLLMRCGGSARSDSPDAARPPAPLVAIESTTVNLPLSLPAQLYVEHDALVYARSTGIVESVFVDLGVPVEQGQLLAQLEHTDQEIALAQFDHAYQAAVRDVERARELMKVRAITTADSEQAELTYQRAELAQRQARRNYELTRIAAPFGGVVTARTVRPGRLVTLGDSLFRVSALGPLRV